MSSDDTDSDKENVSNVDITGDDITPQGDGVLRSEDGTTLPHGGAVSWLAHGEVNKSSSHSRPLHSALELRSTTELDLMASSGRGFLLESSEDDSDAPFRHRVRSKVSQRMATHVPQNVISADNLQKLLDLAEQLGNEQRAPQGAESQKRKGSTSDENSDSDSDPFADRKNRVKLLLPKGLSDPRRPF